jgi:hypothetical protein
MALIAFGPRGTTFSPVASSIARLSVPAVARPLHPYREFESHPLRQLVYCFYIEISIFGIGADYPRVSLRKLAATDSREPNVGSPTACFTQFSQVPPVTVRFFPMRNRGRSWRIWLLETFHVWRVTMGQSLVTVN